jgi:hypothetical protein
VGKYYSRIGGNLYIYVTRDDFLIDLKYFPNELNLFTAESAWRIKDKMAIVNDAEDANVDKAEIILSLNSYKRWDHSAEILEQYYASDDEQLLQEEPEVIVPTPTVEVEKPPEMEVIIPEARPPVLPEAEEVVTPPFREVRVAAPGLPVERRVISVDVSDDEFIDRIIDRMISRGLVFQYRPTPPSVTPQPPPQYEATQPQMTSFDELCGLLVMMLKKEAGDTPTEGVTSSLNELMGAMAAYIRSQTPIPESEKSPATELIDALSDYLKDRTTGEEREAPEKKEDPLRQLLSLLRKEGDRRGRAPSERPHVKEEVKEADYPSSDVRLQRIMAEEVADMYVHMAYTVLLSEVSARSADWLNHIGDHWMELEPLLNLISEDPYYEMVEKKERKALGPLDSLKPELSKIILDELLIRKTETEGEFSEVRELLKEIPVNVIESGVERNYDTFENRMLKAHLQGLVSQLDAFSEVSTDIEGLLNRAIKFSEGSSTAGYTKELTKNRDTITGIEELKVMIQGYLETTVFLDEAKITQELPLETEVLTSHPNYSRFYAMKKSYDVNTPPPLYNIWASLPEMGGSSRLYERWCSVEIVKSLMRIGFRIDEASTHLLDGDRGVVDLDDRRSMLSDGESKVRLTTSQNFSGLDRVFDLEVEDSERKTRYAFSPMFDTSLSLLESSIKGLQRLRDAYNLVVLVHPSEVDPSLSENVYTVTLVPGGSKRSFRELLGAILSEG